MEKQIRNYLKILETSPDNVPAFKALAKIYKDQERWGELANLYVEKAQRTADETKIPELLFQAAELFAERLAKFDRVEECYQKVLDHDPQNERALTELKARYRDSHQWDQLIHLLEQEAEHSEDIDHKADSLTEIADLWEKMLGNEQKQIAYLVQAQQVNPNHLSSLRQLKTYYLKSFQVDRAIELVEREEQLLEGNKEKADLYNEVGLLLAEDPFETQRAIEFLRKAIEIDGRFKNAKKKLEELESLDQKWEKFTRKYLEDAINVSDKREASTIYLKIAGIYYLYNPEAEEDILSTIEKSLILDSSNRRALLLGERYLTEKEQWEKLTEFYQSIYERTRDEALKIEAMAKSAEVLSERLEKRDEALALFREVNSLNPDHPTAFVHIAEDLENREEFDELRELLSDRLERCHEVSARIETLLTLARMAKREDDPKLAIEHLEKILEIEPENERAAGQLADLYEEVQAWDKLLEVMPTVIAAAKDDQLCFDLHAKFAKILSEQLGKSEQAFEHYSAAFAINPQDETVLTQLEDLTIELECWEELVKLFKQVLQQEGDAQMLRSIRFKLAQIYDRELSQYQEAENCYVELLEEQQELEVLDALGRLYSKDLKWEKLVTILGQKAELTDDPEERRDILLEKARIYEMELSDAALAITAYQEVVAIMPDELEALHHLSELYEMGGDYDALTKVIEQELEVITSIPEKVNRNFKLGNLYRDKLQNPEAAGEAFLRVLELDSNHLPAIEMLEELLNQGVSPNEIFKGLEEYYRKLERWDKLAKGYEALIRSEADSEQKGALCHKLAEVSLVHRSMDEEAFTWITEGLKTTYQNADFLKLSLDAARKVGKQSELLELLESKSESVEDEEQKISLSLSLGSLYWEGMQDTEQAERHYLEASELASDREEVMEQVTGFFKETEQWVQFSAFGERLAEIVGEPSRKKEVLFEVADVYENRLKKNDASQVVLRRVLQTDAADLKAIDALLRLQQEAEQWEDLVLTLLEKLDLVEDETGRIALKMQLAEIQEDKLEDYDEAARLYSEVLAKDPKHPDAFAAMELFLERNLCESLVAETLRPIYEEKRDFEKLIHVLTLQYAEVEGEAAYTLAVRIASLYEDELQRFADALEWYGRAFVAGDGVVLLKELMLSASSANNYARLVEICEEKLEQELSDADRTEVLFHIGDTLVKELQKPDDARLRYEAVLEIDANNERAIDALIELARERMDYEDLAQLLEKKRDVVEDKKVRREATFEIAQLRFKRLEQPDEAVALLNELLDERENDPQVFEMLEDVFITHDRWEDQKELLERRLKYLREDDEILPVKIQIGAILENNLDRLDEGMAIYRELVRNYWNYPVVGALVDRLLSQESTQLEIANEMEQKYIKVQDWKRLVQVYEIQVHYTEGSEEKSKLLSKLSNVYQNKLQDPEKAFDGFARVFIGDPNNTEALDELEKLAGDLGAWRELAEVYEKAGEAAPDHDEATALFIKAARLYEDILAYQEDSIRAYRKVLDRDRNNMTAIQALEGLCRKTERWEELRDIYLQRINLTEDTAEKKELYTNICILYEHQLEDPLGATPFYEATVELTPQDIEAVDKLMELYQLQEDWEKKAGLMAHKLELVDSLAERNELMLAKAELHEVKLDQAEISKDLYKHVLESDESDTRSLEKLEEYVEREEFQDELARFLEPMYLRWENWERVIDMQEHQFTHSEDGDERIRLLKAIANNYEEHLDQNLLAYGVLTRAFRERPLDEFIQNELERLAGVLGQYEQLCSLYGELIDGYDPETESDTMVNLLMNLAHLSESYLREIELAAGHYRRVLELSENHPEALGHLERIYSLQKKWPELIEVLESKNAITEELEQKKAILFQVCNIFEEELGENRQAIDTYRRMLELDGRDDDVLRSLVRLTTTEDMWEDLIEVRYRQLDIAETDDQRWNLRHAIGMVLWRKLTRKDEAIEIFNGVLEENHGYPPCRDAMEGLMEEGDSELAAARILEPLYTEDERWNDLIQTLSIQARHAEEAEAKRDFFLRMAELAELKLSAPERAFPFTVSAFENDAFNPAIRDQLERLAAEVSRWEDLAVAYRDRAEAMEEVEQQVDLYLNAGRIKLREVVDPEGAETFYLAARERQGDNLEALDALDEIFNILGKWDELVDVIYTKADLAEQDEAKIDLYVRAAVIREEKTEDKTGAVSSYLKALAVDENHSSSLAELDRLYGELSRWAELRDIISRRIELAESDATRNDLTYRKGQVVEQKLNDKAAAIELYHTILQADDEYFDAIESLEAMVLEPEYQQVSLDILVPLFETKGWWERLTETLEAQFDTLTDVSSRVEVLTRIKDVYENEMSDAPRAFQVSCRIFQEDFHDVAARQEMERLAVVTGGFEGLVETYHSFAEQVPEQELKLEILTKIARINEEQLQNDEQAMEVYQRVLELDDKNFTAMLALDRLYERLERYSDLVDLIPLEFDFYDDPKELVELRLRLGSLWEEKLHDALTAIEVYSQVLAEQPDNVTALTALERLYEQVEMWPELVEIYKAEVRIARGDTKKARLYAKMAQVYSDKMDSAGEAIPLWKRVLQFDEQNEEVMVKLEALYEHEEMWDELVNHYKNRLRGARGVQERAGITSQMARLYLERLNQEDQATQLYLKVLEYTPDDLGVIDILEEIYVRNQAWRDLVDLLHRLVPQVQGAELRSLYLRLASLQVERLDNLEKGADFGRQVLDMDPTVDELARMERIFRDSKAYELYLNILTRQSEQTEEAATKVALYFRMAEIWLERLDKEVEAKHCYENVLELIPDNLQAAESLEPIYRRDGAWSDLIKVLDIRLTEADGEERIELMRQKADICQNNLGDPSGAFDALSPVFQNDPGDAELMARMEQLADATTRHLDLAHLLRDLLPETEQEQRLFRSLTFKVAEIYENKAINADLAAEYFKMFLESGEYSEHAVDFLIGYYEEVEDWDELISAYQQKLPYMNTEEKVVVGCRVADIFDSKLGEAERAIKTYHQVLKMDDRCEPAIDALILIYDRQRDWTELVEQLRHKLHLVTDAQDISEIRLRIARLYQDQIGDLDQAKTFYRAIIAVDPKHGIALDELECIYVEEENYDELLEVLSRRINVTDSDEEKLGIYRKMADIWETKFEQLDMAVNYLERMLAIDASNLEAITTLERIYREASDWPSLAQTYQRHIDQTIDSEEIVRLYTEMGKIHGEYLFLPAKAIEYFTKALKIDENNLDVMEALSELYTANEKWEPAIETLERMAELTQDKARKVDVLSRLGNIYLVSLDDQEKAKQVFDRMVAEDPTFVPALRALRRYYASTENWPEFLRMVEEEKRYVEDGGEKAELLYEEGRYYHELERDVDRAVILYREALELADDFQPVLKVLGNIYFERQEWEQARVVLSKLLETPDALDEMEQARVHYQLAFIAEKEEDDGEALKHYTASYRLDSNTLPTLEGLARTLFKRGDWDRAFRVYQTILVRFREQKSIPELVELFCRLGEVNGKLEKNDVAVRMYEKALELDSESIRALKAIVFFYESLENWKKVLQYRSRLIKRLTGDELFEQWKAVGDVYSDHMDDPDKGLEAYRFALEVNATDIVLLKKVADLLLAQGNIDDAIGVMRSSLMMEKEPERLIELNQKLAELLLEHRKDVVGAIDCYNAILDLQPERSDMFERIEGILTEREDWESLDTNYRLMIQRYPAEDTVNALALWKKLGNLLVEKAGNLEDGIQAWEVVAQLDAENPDTQEKIADLYAMSPKYRDKAVEMHRTILQRDPMRVNSYRALWKIAFEAEEFDKAFCYAGVVHLLGRSDTPAAAFYQENLKDVKNEAINTLDRQLWGSLLLHESARHNVGQVLTILFHHVHGLMDSDLKKEGLKKKDRLDLGEHVSFATTMTYILKTMGLPEPEIFMKQGFGPGIEVLSMQPASIKIGADAFENYPKRELMFLATRAAVLARPDFLMTQMLPENTVRDLLDASALIFDNRFKTTRNPKELKDLQKRLEKGTPKKVREPLAQFVSEYARLAGELDIAQWKEALMLSANRAALLMCNDISMAVETLRKHPGGLSEEQVEQCVTDLIQFSISDQYFHLRNYLGFTII